MIEILAVSGDAQLCKRVQEVFVHLVKEKKINQTPEEMVHLTMLNEIDIEKIRKMKINGDVMIARGAIAHLLQKVYFDVPIVEIPVLRRDMLGQLHESGEQYKGKKLCVIGTKSMTLGVTTDDIIWEKSIFLKNINSIDEMKTAVDEVIAGGMEVICGGSRTCAYAIQKGAEAILMASSKAAITYAILEGIRIAKLHIEHKRQSLYLTLAFDRNDDGMIALDQNFDVTLFNMTARKQMKILKTRRLIGENLKDIPVCQEIKDILLADSPQHKEVVQIEERAYVVETIPLNARGMNIGKMLTLRSGREIHALEGMIREKRCQKDLKAHCCFEKIIGASPAILSAIKIARAYAQAPSNVLIEGETGVGKELFAQSMHNASQRKNGPFVAINCGAIQKDLLENEFFGYGKGVFKGSKKEGQMGIFELAHGGTIFLNEISEIPYELQGRLLRVLQEREVMCIGDNRIIPIDVKIISATNKKLEACTLKGEFREDLYYRLDVLRLELPPLRERREDIMSLVKTFMTKNGKTHRAFEYSPRAIDALMNYEWRGNTRELKNICERLSIISRNKKITLGLLMEVMPQLKYKKIETSLIQGDFDEQIRTIERNKMKKMMNEKQGKKGEVAKELKISRTTLWRKLKELELE